MKARPSLLPARTACGVLLILAGAPGGPPPAAAAEETFDTGWLELSMGGASVSGDRAQFQQRHGFRAGEPIGGIESFHWERFFGKGSLLAIDGRAIFDNHDYLVKLRVENPDVGYVRFGYREFRTWYDGSGGFFPGNSLWLPVFDNELSLDRGEFWFETGLTLPDKPEIHLRYSHQFRDGRKSSTVWGDTALTGGFGLRKIVPAYWDIDEARDTVQLDVRHTIGLTDWGAGVRAEWIDQSNDRVMHRFPGESPPPNTDRIITQRDGVETDLVSAHGFTRTRFNERVWLTLGGSFTTLDTDVSGFRMADPAGTDSEFFDLIGGAQLKQYVANVNVMLTPWDALVLVPALRVEHQYQEGFANFIEGGVEQRNERDRHFTEVTESLDLRYTGVTNWVFSARGEWLQGQGHLDELEINNVGTGLLGVFRHSDTDRFTQKYALTVNWYPDRRFNAAAQYYHRERLNEYHHRTDSTSNTSGNRYPAYITEQEFVTDDVNFRITWRPLSSLTLVSRYDFQWSDINTETNAGGSVDSAKWISHIFSQSVTWSPWHRLYLQAGGTYSIDTLTTPANALTGAAANLVAKSRNGYWSASGAAGFVVSERTDLEARYSFYKADNFINNFAVSQPYGADVEEHFGSLTVAHRISPRTSVKLTYGYVDYRDRTSGGNNNYAAHLVFSSVQYRF